MKNFRRAILFANGDFPEEHSLIIEKDDFLVAVDGGLRHLIHLGLMPQLLIGDLDSVSPQELGSCMDWGVEVLRFPPEKDLTDLELAILEVLRRGFNEIVLTCAIGGRLDHTLGNLALLALPDLRDCHTYISHGNTAIYLINDHIDLPSYPGNLLSLLPWGEVVQGVTTAGLHYALNDATLYPWKTLGLSNVATSHQVTVSLKSGHLFLFHVTKTTKPAEKENYE